MAKHVEVKPMHKSSAMIGGAIALMSWYAQKSGWGMWMNDETIRAGVLQSSELAGIVMAMVGRYKATSTLKLWR